MKKKIAHILKKGTLSPINISVLKLNSRFGDNRYKIILKKITRGESNFQKFHVNFFTFFSVLRCEMHVYSYYMSKSFWHIIDTSIINHVCKNEACSLKNMAVVTALVLIIFPWWGSPLKAAPMVIS